MGSDEADAWRHRAEAAIAAGDQPNAIACLRRAASLYTADADPPPAARRAHADACRRLAELLVDAGRVPEAMQAYQEAADAYGSVAGGEAEADECARLIVRGVRGLWRQPRSRLLLLIARLEREQRQLAETADTEAQRADLSFRMATIFQRRDRFPEAAERLTEALGLYAQAPDSGLQQAACHQRLAGLYHHELDDPDRAAAHYRQAIRLFAAHEPVSEGEQMNRSLCEWLLAQLTGHDRA